MDRTVPAGAAILLDFVRLTETGRDDRASYDVVYGHNKTAKPITSMTVDEWIAAGPRWTRRHGSSAAGGYQFMNATLKDLKRELGLRGSQVIDPDLQDRLAYHLLKRRGYSGWASYTISDVTFANRLAMEWASFPVLSSINGKRPGQSYYAGDGLNKALVSISAIKDVLNEARRSINAETPHDTATPPAADPGIGAGDERGPRGMGAAIAAVLVALGGLMAAFWETVTNWIGSIL